MGRRAHRFFVGGGGGVVLCRHDIKEKSPDFRSPEVGISAIRTQTQMIRTQATGCFVPILFAVEIRFHQPKQRLTVSLVFAAEQ